MSNHTPLPWRTFWNYLNILTIENKDCIVICKMNVISQKRANAELIVRAVNSHDELLEACEIALEQLYETDDEAAHPVEVYKQIEQAITEATQ